MNMDDEFEFFAESFYMRAWRLREVLRELPGLKRFDSESIRSIRNFLIDHPDKRGGVLRRGVGFGGEDGPQLKIARDGDEQTSFVDRGLFLNAVEMRLNLQSHLERLLGLSKGTT